MTYKDKLSLLKSYKKLVENLEYLENRILKLQSVKYEQNYGGIGKTTNELLDEKAEVLKEIDNIEVAIDNMEYSNYKEILQNRFIKMLTVKKTAVKMGYCESHIKNLQRRAIQSLEL